MYPLFRSLASYAVVLAFAATVVLAVGTPSAHAEWVLDDYTWSSAYTSGPSETGNGTVTAVTLNNGKGIDLSISGTITYQQTSMASATLEITGYQDYVWNGGGSSTSTFQATRTANANGSRSASGSTYSSSGGTQPESFAGTTYYGLTYNVTPTGSAINVTRSSTNTSFAQTQVKISAGANGGYHGMSPDVSIAYSGDAEVTYEITGVAP